MVPVAPGCVCAATYPARTVVIVRNRFGFAAVAVATGAVVFVGWGTVVAVAGTDVAGMDVAVVAGFVTVTVATVLLFGDTVDFPPPAILANIQHRRSKPETLAMMMLRRDQLIAGIDYSLEFKYECEPSAPCTMPVSGENTPLTSTIRN